MSTLETVVLYLLVFGISIVLCASNQTRFEKLTDPETLKIKDYLKTFATVSLIVLPIVIIAGYRGDSVGVDTSNYIRIYYNNASVFENYWDLYRFIGESPLFVRLVWDSYHIFKSPIFYMAVSQYITVASIVIYGIMNAKKYPVWMALCVYCLWFFNDSLNATRQFIAIAIILVAYQLTIYKQWKKAIILFALALGFHRSAIIIIPVLIFLRLIKFETNLIKINSIVALMIIVLLWGQRLFEILINKGILPARYNLYINTFIYRNSKGVSSWILTGTSKYAIFEIGVRTGILLMCIIMYIRGGSDKSKEHYQYMYILLFDILIYAVGVYVYKTVYFIRLSAFFDFFVINLVPLLEQKMCVSFKKIRIRSMVIVFSLAYWGVHVVYYGSGATIPYYFR